MEAQLCADEEIAIVGGANSAGQAAMFLAQTAKRVHMLIRGDALAKTMSRYLISRIEAHPRVELHTRTEIVGLEGNGHVEQIAWRTGRTGPVEKQKIRHVFTMTGAEPSTKWLAGCLALDQKGFIKTGAALTPDDLAHREVAAASSAVSARNEPSGRPRRGRRAERQHQAGRVGRGRGLDCGCERPPNPGRVGPSHPDYDSHGRAATRVPG